MIAARFNSLCPGYRSIRHFASTADWTDPMLDVEAWERMTFGGALITIDESTAGIPVNPWGLERFREPTPPGGLRWRTWEDR